MKSKSNLITISLVVLFSTRVFGAVDISLGAVNYSGNGCPPRSQTQVSLSADRQLLKVTFDRFIVNAGGGGSLMTRKVCDINTVIHIPAGLCFSVDTTEYRGLNFLPNGAVSVLSSTLTFDDRPPARFTKTFQGPMNDEFTEIHPASLVVPSPCGGDIAIEVMTAIRLITNQQREETMSAANPADVSGSIFYHLRWAECGSR